MKVFEQFLKEAMSVRSAFYLPRAMMPQVTDIESFKAFLAQHGVQYATFYSDLTDVRPTQSDYDENKVKSIAASNPTSERYDPIIIAHTANGQQFVVDGHHRYHAAKSLGLEIPVIDVQIEVADLIRMMQTYQHAINTDIGGDPAE